MKTKFFTLFTALTLSAGALFASDTDVDGIYYNFDATNLTATVTYRGSYSGSYADEYTGNVVIPATVNYDGKIYSVTSIGNGAFEYCSGLTSVTIPNSVTSIGEFAFSGCSSLTKTNYTGDIAGWCGINFGNYSANPTAYSYNLYINDVEVKDLVIPNSVTSIGNYAFSGCSGLTSITIPNSVTSIGEYAFSGCSGLTSITIPNSVTSIGEYAFKYCSSLTSVTIPNSVTSIGRSAFYGCSGLTSVTIPNSVTSIGKSAFGECTQLTNIVCYAAEPPSCDASVFANYDASLKVPCSSLDAYKADAVWGDFNNISCIESTVGLEQIELADLYTQAGRIVCNGEFRIYDLLGRDVTRLNGSLCGVYVVKTANAAVKVVVR
ncbi:MAG: leucine-rich repeat domain-containing protein [Paludibacteraceae bacterium]|nr:leucine-rich repeat domain-containing protein [Paludibacteraceae bacterium]